MTGGMMFKGTPGPWLTGDFLGEFNTEWSAELERYPKNGVSTSQPIVHNGKTIALVVWEGWDDERGEGTAYAMAAAIDLLDIAKRSLSHAMTAKSYRKERGWDTSNDEDKFLEDARAAIAKALGEKK